MNICIVQPAINVVSETFMRAHAERLPGHVTVVHSVNSGRSSIRDRPVLSQTVFSRGMRKLGRIIARRPWEWEITASLLAAFRRIRPHVVLAEYGTTGVVALEACRRACVPLVAHFHGFDASNRSCLDEYREGYRRLFREAAFVVAVSRAMRRRLISLGAPPEKVCYSPYGVDCARFDGADPAASRSVFLAVGRFVEKKAPYLTLLAFADVYRSHPDSRLRMIGDGPLLGPCRTMATALGLRDAVTFLGPQPHEVVQEEMRKSRAFVQHSIEAADGDCEGMPVAILEAGASGLPVVATRHAGIPDVVIDEETGLLVDERDIGGMAQRMKRLVDDPGLGTRLGEAARIRVAASFSMQQSIDRLWSILEASVRGTPLAECRRADAAELTPT